VRRPVWRRQLGGSSTAGFALPQVELGRRHEGTVALVRAITAPVPVDLLVTDRPRLPSMGPSLAADGVAGGPAVYDRAA
jgi:hypothetical protein